MKQVKSFAPINFEATKASLKRFGEELQIKTPKRLKDDEAKDAEPAKKSRKRRKQMAKRKDCIQTLIRMILKVQMKLVNKMILSQ
ncbi:hypothetical protein Tco_0339038, partial [Tanacetum coccineum]